MMMMTESPKPPECAWDDAVLPHAHAPRWPPQAGCVQLLCLGFLIYRESHQDPGIAGWSQHLKVGLSGNVTEWSPQVTLPYSSTPPPSLLPAARSALSAGPVGIMSPMERPVETFGSKRQSRSRMLTVTEGWREEGAPGQDGQALLPLHFRSSASSHDQGTPRV